mgnify:CR=1 FL=1
MRKEIKINLRDGDKELTFSIKQMSALKLERFINRAVIIIAKSIGGEIGKMDFSSESLSNLQKLLNSSQSGLNSPQSGFADKLVQFIGKLDYDAVEPLYNELLDCCKLVPEPNNPLMTMDLTPTTVDSHIENPMTLYRLRVEAVKLNFSFFRGVMSSPEEEIKPQVTFPKRTKTSRH